MSVIDTLITDRTQEDVDERTTKGHYNASDLNRVAQAMNYIANIFNQRGYHVSIFAKTDWTITDIPTQSQMQQYIANINTLRSAISVFPSTPIAPSDMAGFSWQEANDIESILRDLNDLLTNMALSWYYSGDLFAGEV